MPENDKRLEVTTELSGISTQIEETEAPQAPETQETTRTPDQQAAEQANEKAAAEALAEQEKTVKEAVVAQTTKVEANEVLTDQQKALEVTRHFKELSESIKPDESGMVILTQQQLQELDRIEQLLAFNPQVSTIPQEYTTLITREDFLDAESIRSARKRVREQLRKEKRAEKQLEKFLQDYEKLLNQRNHNNYLLNRLGACGQINTALEQGIYINTPIAFFEEQPLLAEIYKQKKRIKTNPRSSLSLNGKTVEVCNQKLMQEAYNDTNTYIQSCGGYANIAEKWLNENTKMSHGQARNAVNTLATLGIIGAAFAVGKWLFTNKEGKFSFSFGKIAALIGIPMLANYGSQAATGKGLLENINTLRRTGKLPWNIKALDQATGIEKIALNQNMIQFVLLGVPFSVLAGCAEQRNGIITKLNLGKLKDYYNGEIQKAENNNDQKTLNILKSQLEALNSISSDKDTEKHFYQELEKMHINADEVANPNNTQKTLNEKLYNNSQRFANLENYCSEKKLKINEEERSVVEERIFNTHQESSKSDFEKMLEEGLLIPDNPIFERLESLDIPASDKIALYSAYKTIAGMANIENLSLEVNDREHIILKAYDQKIKLNIKQKHLDGFIDATGTEIPLGSVEELLDIGLLINMLKNEHNTRGETPDLQKQNDEYYPFSLSTTRYDRIFQNIVFKHNNGKEITILSDRIPILSTMDRKFPTIEAGQNRNFFVKYLNTLWKQEHPA